MPNVFKFSESSSEKSLRKGNFSIGVGDVPKGPSSVTGFYQGITPPVDGWMIYKKIDGDTLPFRIYSATQGSLVNIVNRIEGKTFSQIWECLNHYALTSSSVIVNKDFPPIVTDGLVHFLDFSNTTSYPTTASSLYDLSSKQLNGSFQNTPTYEPFDSSISLDGINDYLAFGNSTMDNLGILGSFTFETTIFANPTAIGGDLLGWGGYNPYWGYSMRTSISDSQSKINAFLIYQDSGGNWRQSFNSAASNKADTGRWVSFSITFNEGNIRHYVNSTPGTTVSLPLTGNNKTTSILTFGIHGWNYFNGKVSSTKIYNRPLSAQEISQNYYGSPIVTNGLIWAVDAGRLVSYPKTGTVWYDMVGSGTGSLTSGPVFDEDGGGCIDFDGSDDEVIFSVNSLYNTTSVTVEAWVNLVSDGSRHIILANWSGWALEVNSNSSVVMYVYNSEGQVGATTTTGLLTFGVWTHITGTYDSNLQEIKTYVNGALGATRVNTSSILYGVSTRRISPTVYSGGPVNNKISIVRQWNRALTSEEISTNYRAQKWRFS